jgi:hypothetical protein
MHLQKEKHARTPLSTNISRHPPRTTHSLTPLSPTHSHTDTDVNVAPGPMTDCVPNAST